MSKIILLCTETIPLQKSRAQIHPARLFLVQECTEVITCLLFPLG